MAGEGRLRLAGMRGRQNAAYSFEQQYRSSYALVYNYVYRRVPQRESAEDVVAEAFLNAARYFDRFDPTRAKFSTWVISIARNCINDHYGKNTPTAPLEDVPEGAYATHDDLGEAEARRDLATRLIGKLSDDERELVFLKYYEGRRNTEIAQILGMNSSTVSTRLARALAKMRVAVS